MKGLQINLESLTAPAVRRKASTFEWFIFHCVVNSRNIIDLVKEDKINEAVQAVVGSELKRLSMEDRAKKDEVAASIEVITKILVEGVEVNSTTDVTSYIDELE